MLIQSVAGEELSVRLKEPFVIANGRIECTRAVLVRVELIDERSGHGSMGIGEAAPLPPVTREDQPDVQLSIADAGTRLRGRKIGALNEIDGVLDEVLGSKPVARAGVECALLDAWARIEGRSICTLLRGKAPGRLATDITLPIAAPAHTGELAADYRALGFRTFKLKVGKDFDTDLRTLEALHARVPDGIVRLDANEGFDSHQALELLRRAGASAIAIECFEQPCARADLEGMARVTREGGVPVIADEAVRDLDDLAQVHKARAAHGVNLKLAKLGGLLCALALGERARADGLSIMCGGMVETRLGMSAMAHLACALGSIEYVDLDTAFLLAEERFEGGYTAHGAELALWAGPGHTVRCYSAASHR